MTVSAAFASLKNKDVSDSTKAFISTGNKDLQTGSTSNPEPESAHKAGDKGHILAVAPLLIHNTDTLCQQTEILSQVSPGLPESLALISKQVIKVADSGNRNRKIGFCYPRGNKSVKINENGQFSQQTELSDNVKETSDLFPVLLQHSNFVSSPKSSSVVKIQVKPVETHLALSSPVMNAHNFKSMNTAIVYSSNDCSKITGQQIHMTSHAKRIFSEKHNDRSKLYVSDISQDSVVKLAETRIHPDYPQADNSAVRSEAHDSSQTVTQNSVDRVDQQLYENRKQIDVPPSVAVQGNSSHARVAPTKNVSENNTDAVSSHSKTLPRPYQQTSVGRCSKASNRSNVLQQIVPPFENTDTGNSRKIQNMPTARKYSDGSLIPGCYSSLPRGHHNHHVYRQPLDHRHTVSNHSIGQYDNLMHQQIASNVKDSLSQTFQGPLSPRLLRTDSTFQDLMKSRGAPQVSLLPSVDTALDFHYKKQNIARLPSAPDSLTSVKFSKLHYPQQSFNQSTDMTVSSVGSSFKSFTQASFYRHHSNEATASFQYNTAAREHINSVNGSPQPFTSVFNMSEPHSLGMDLSMMSASMLNPLKLPQMKSHKDIGGSFYGYKNNHINTSSTEEGITWTSDSENSKSYKFEVLLKKEVGVSFGINIVRKTVTGTSCIFIQDVVPGSSVEKDSRLRKGDLLMSINGVSMKDLTLLDAHQMLRSLPPGPVQIVASRDVFS
ncbi:unnamed protein product [Candidula unifasciata]|uniref:PDZ domain-containing protein n=1 Tax=Candidula unifasciata TaxID=100452 RepID=A0A8S3ZGY8_9EUPU|nr:unnamed protein product [Candidula unifasciata]